MKEKVFFITGSTDGIGKLTAIDHYQNEKCSKVGH